MTLEKTLSNVALEAAKHADLANQLIEDVKDGIDTIEVVSQNHSVMDDWRTKTGKVAFKDLAGNTHQVDTLATIIADAEKINPNPHVMTKAQFDALRDIRKKQYAGSGFVEWGKHTSSIDTSTTQVVQNGLYTFLTNGNQNTLQLGRGASSSTGVSRTNEPVAVMDGAQLSILGVNTATFDDFTSNTIGLPPAPDGTKTYDSATGVITEHASAAEAFEGLVNNGDFRKGDNGDWAVPTGYNITDGSLNADGTGARYTKVTQGPITIDNGITHKLVVSVNNVSSSSISICATGSPSFTGAWGRINVNAGETGTFEVEFTPDKSTAYVLVQANTANQKFSLSSVSVIPVTEQVITSRKDLVFLESWHEKIADKDVVYPLGNVQYGANSYDGIGLLNNLVAQGYSAFGEWDADTTGHGAKWSSLSETNRAKLLANPAHNIYYDPEAKAYIQVRYRIRVVEGLGNDWTHTGSKPIGATGWRMQYPQSSRVKPQGQHSFIPKDFDEYTEGATGLFVGGDASQSYNLNPDVGSLIAASTSLKRDTNVAHDGKCFAVSIALVQRMNQGAYHPTYNPMGCAQTDYIGSGGGWWYNSNAYPLASTGDCFIHQRNGSIGSASYGRSDQYKYYDAIYAGQVEDLRLNANKFDVNQLREESIRKAVAGEMRGKGSVPKLRIQTFEKNGGFFNNGYWMGKDGNAFFAAGADFDLWHTLPWLNSLNRNQPLRGRAFGACYLVRHDNNAVIQAEVTDAGSSGRNVYCSAQVDVPDGTTISIVMYDTTSSEFDSLPWVDIIGDPERIAATFPDGVVGQWIPQIPDGSSKEFQLNSKMNGSGFDFVVRSLDNGSSWVGVTTQFNGFLSTTRNSLTNSLAASYVALLTYESPSNFTEASSISSVIDEQGGIWYGAHYQPYFGNRLQPSLTGKVATNNKSGAGTNAFGFAKLERYVLNEANFPRDPSFSSIYASWMNVPLNMSVPTNNSSAVKTVHSVVEKDGLLYLQFHGAELKYDTPTIVQITLNNSEIKATKGSIYRVASEVNSPLAGGVWYCNTNTSAAFDDITWSKNSDGNIRAGGSVSDPNIYFIPHYVAGWGDDQVIPIVSGENVKTDLNGNTVKVFCHHTQIPIGIAHHG